MLVRMRRVVRQKAQRSEHECVDACMRESVVVIELGNRCKVRAVCHRERASRERKSRGEGRPCGKKAPRRQLRYLVKRTHCERADRKHYERRPNGDAQRHERPQRRAREHKRAHAARTRLRAQRAEQCYQRCLGAV